MAKTSEAILRNIYVLGLCLLPLVAISAGVFPDFALELSLFAVVWIFFSFLFADLFLWMIRRSRFYQTGDSVELLIFLNYKSMSLLFSLIFFLAQFSFLTLILLPGVNIVDKFCLAIFMGLLSGTQCLSVGHYLIHQYHRWYRALGTMLFLTMGYSHFRFAHVMGHHGRVAEESDFDSPKMRQNIFSFFIENVWEEIKFTLNPNIAKDIKENKHKKYRLLVLFDLLWCLSWVILFLYNSLHYESLLYIGYLLFSRFNIELVNYLQHYGTSSYEPLTHSNDATHKVTNWFSFAGGCHSQHHRRPNFSPTEYQFESQRLHSKSFLILYLMSLFPPLFYTYMGKVPSEGANEMG